MLRVALGVAHTLDLVDTYQDSDGGDGPHCSSPPLIKHATDIRIRAEFRAGELVAKMAEQGNATQDRQGKEEGARCTSAPLSIDRQGDNQ